MSGLVFRMNGLKLQALRLCFVFPVRLDQNIKVDCRQTSSWWTWLLPANVLGSQCLPVLASACQVVLASLARQGCTTGTAGSSAGPSLTAVQQCCIVYYQV